MKKYFLTITILWLFVSQVIAQNVKRPDTYNFNRGIECLREGNDVDAYGYFEKETRDNPNNGYAYVWMGLILSNNDMFGDALTMLEKAQKYIPSKDKEYISMVYRVRGDVYSDLNDYEEAVSNYTKAIKLCPKDSRCYNDRAELYYLMEKYELSDRDYDKIIELDPNDSQGYMGKGRNAIAQKKYEDAIKQLDYVVKLYGKDYSQCYAFRAEAYAKIGQYDKAADDIIMAISIDGNDKALYLLTTIMADYASDIMISKFKIQQLKEPNVAWWPYCIGLVYQTIEIYNKAIEYYNKANAINASDVISGRISHCYSEIGDYYNALQYIDEAIQTNPSRVSYRFSKADIEYEAGMIEEALTDISSCIAAYPEYYGYYYRKGFYEDNAGMTDDAIEDYSTAILLEPDYFYSYLGRGDMFLKKGMMDKAMEDYRKVVKMDTIPSTSSCAQFAYLALGEIDKAIDFNQRILDSFPDDMGVYYDAACLFARMSDNNKAISYLRNSFEKGYRRFSHLNRDDDFDTLRDNKDFHNLIAEYRSKYEQQEEFRETVHDNISVEIPFTKSGGVTEVQCSINGLPLHFVFDTGASDVTISMVEATFMLKNKYLTPLDVVGKQNYLTADGNISEGTVINLKSVKIGDLELTNVRASVVKSQNAPLLLGQSVLGRLGKIEIDNEKRMIRITH